MMTDLSAYKWITLDTTAEDCVEDSIIYACVLDWDRRVMRWQRVQWFACGERYCVEIYYN
jgi:hypothetical protein